MERTELKKEVEHLLKSLPEDADWDDLMFKIYVRQSVEQGLKDSRSGRVISHEVIWKKYQLAKWESSLSASFTEHVSCLNAESGNNYRILRVRLQ